MIDKTKATRMVSATFKGVSMKKDEYFAKTPRLMKANKNNDTGNWTFSNFSKKEGNR
jgi:hypothetical protein